MKNIFFYSPYYSCITLGICVYCVIYLMDHPPPPKTSVEKVKVIKNIITPVLEKPLKTYTITTPQPAKKTIINTNKLKTVNEKQPLPYICNETLNNLKHVKTKTSPSFEIFIHPVKEDIHVSGSIQRNGVWEGAQISLFTRLLKKYPRSLFIDVGANIGMYSLVAAANKHMVIGFEPLKKNLDVICSSIKYNKWENYIKLYNIALSNKHTKVSFRTPIENAGGTQVYYKRGLHGTENVDFAYTHPFDFFNIKYNGKIIMKIDIEGHECLMFEKMNEFFKHNKVVAIFMEWGQLAKKCGNMIANILYEHGLKVYDSNGNKELKKTRIPWYRHWDVVWL